MKKIFEVFRPKKSNETISRYEELTKNNHELLSQLLKEDEDFLKKEAFAK